MRPQLKVGVRALPLLSAPGHLSDGDVVAEGGPQLELSVFLAEERLEHFIIDGVAQLLAAGARLEAVADDAVHTGKGFFLAGNENPAQPRLHGVGSSLLQKNTRRALAERTENFIADGLRPGGNFVSADVFVFLPSQQDHFIAHDAVGNIRHVQRAHVHGHSSDDRRSPTADQGFAAVGQEKRVAVAVADRDGRHASFFLRDVGAVVADAVARGKFLDQNDRRFKRHDGRQMGFVPGFV